jgi:4-hydroxybenzoate polyprenyltransferase
LKIFVIAFVWATVTVILPVLSGDTEAFTSINFLIEFVQRLVFVVALTLPFDIRDIRFDTHQLGTIPQMIGIKQSRILGVVMLTLVVLFEFLKTPLLIDQALILAGICSFTGFLIMQSVVKQTEYYASFWVESIPVIWCVLLILF